MLAANRNKGEAKDCGKRPVGRNADEPTKASSGKQRWVHWRWACPKFVRQTFHEWAAHSIGSSAWARAYYEQQRAKGKPRNTVERALAFKWIRILFRCWKDRKPYCEDLYREAVARHQQRATTSSPVQDIPLLSGVRAIWNNEPCSGPFSWVLLLHQDNLIGHFFDAGYSLLRSAGWTSL